MWDTTAKDLTAAIASVAAWFSDAYASIEWHKAQGLEFDPAASVEEILAATAAHVSNRTIATLEYLEGQLPDMTQRFKRLEEAFDAHFAIVPAEYPEAREYAREVRELLTTWREQLVSLTATAAQGSKQAIAEGQATREPEFARVAPVAARVKQAIRDATGLATLRMRRMAKHLDEKYGEE